jgi:DNA-binding NarL/FixJ family response regulator
MSDSKRNPSQARALADPRKRVFLIDDHPVFRRGLAQSINDDPDLRVCGEARDAAEGLSGVLKEKPDLVLLDLSLPGKSGLDLLKDLQAAAPEVQVMIVSMHEEELFAERALRAGVRGYIMKNEDPPRMIAAIKQVLGGRIYVSGGVASNIFEGMAGKTKADPVRGGVEQLSDREFEIFQMLGQGRTTSEIARGLNIAMRTVVVHCSNIRRKLKVRHAAELMRYAVRWTENSKS